MIWRGTGSLLVSTLDLAKWSCSPELSLMRTYS